MKSRILSLLLVATVAVIPGLAKASQVEIPCDNHQDSRMDGWTDTGIGLTSSLGLPAGRYAPTEAPAAPTTLVVMFHGHGNDTCSWRRHLQQAADRGAIAVAMDYTGQAPRTIGDKTYDNYGWNVKEGAADSIEAAQYFLAQFPTITNVIAFGISMGGNSSGLAVSAGALRQAPRTDAGAPLFDYWIDVEGVNNLIEEYFVARGVGPVNAGGKQAQDEIEEENGGSSFEEDPAAYAEITNILRAPDMSALKGAVVVNGLDDGLVPTDQSPQMATALNAAGVPAHLYTVLFRGNGEAGTTGTGILPGVFKIPYESSFAGHGWEGSDTQLVIKTGFDQLWALMAGGSVDPGETLVPGLTG
ncbi:MAG: alpha/beta hydrolase [Actinobacteria bacterium]|nr:alpha/beta hydrolase [Actinomycetota bacterium]